MTTKRKFDHEKLEVYQLELKFVEWASTLIEEIKSAEKGNISSREALDHLDRASLSALFNTAEGNGKRFPRQRARFIEDARGSATECAACLDALVAKGLCGVARVEEGKATLHSIVSILTALVKKFAELDRSKDLMNAGLKEKRR